MSPSARRRRQRLTEALDKVHDFNENGVPDATELESSHRGFNKSTRFGVQQ